MLFKSEYEKFMQTTIAIDYGSKNIGFGYRDGYCWRSAALRFVSKTIRPIGINPYEDSLPIERRVRMFDSKKLSFLSVFFLLVLGCASGTATKTEGPSVSEAQAVSAVGPKARIVVAQFVNNTGGLEAQLQRMAIHARASIPDHGAMMEFQEKMMNYQGELMRYQARLNEVGSEKAGPPPKAPKYPKATSSPYMRSLSDPVAGGIRDMMINALFNSRRFIVLERQNIEKIDWEQEFSNSADAGKETSIPIGQIEGAELLLIGSLNTLEAKQSGGNLGGVVSSLISQMMYIGTPYAEEITSADVSWDNVKTAMEIRLVDARTSRVVAATTVEGKATSMGFWASKTKYTYNAGALPVGFSMYQNTPVEDAFRKMVDATVEFLISKTPERYYHIQE